jgi:hypothetical protein
VGEAAADKISPETTDRINARVKSAWWLPSPLAAMFILPVALLYWRVGGPSGLLADPSTGVHVRTGQWILAHHAAPTWDLFSFTMPHRGWCDWEWGSDAIFAVVYQLHGLSAVAGLALALLCLISVVIYRRARLYAGPVATGMTCALVMAATTIHWLARPHLFTWLALALACWRLERPASNKELCALTVMMVLWVNFHPGFVAGFLVLAACLAGAVLESWLGTTRGHGSPLGRRVRWYALAIAVAAAATLLNPYGIGLDRHIISYLFSPSTVTAHVSEWLSPDFYNPRLAWFEVLVPLAAAAGVWHGLKRRFYWCLLIFGFMHLALLSVRNVPLFAIVSAAPLAAAGEEVLAKLDSWRYVREAEGVTEGTRRLRITLTMWGLGFAALFAVGISPLRLGAGSRIPVAAIRRLPPGQVFTTDKWADYLIYAQPGRKVFFDGRNDFYGPGFARRYLQIMRAQPGWQKALARYDVSVALVPSGSSISAALQDDAGWRDLYCGSQACVFERKELWKPSLSASSRKLY